MKKTMILLLCFLTTILNAQQDSFPQDTDKKNEITLTPLVLIVSGWADISYEYLINQIGILNFTKIVQRPIL